VGGQKYSFHQSGDWRHAWNTAGLAEEFTGPPRRLLDQWQRPEPDGFGWIRAFTIWVPSEDVIDVPDVLANGQSAMVFANQFTPEGTGITNLADGRKRAAEAMRVSGAEAIAPRVTLHAREDESGLRVLYDLAGRSCHARDARLYLPTKARSHQRPGVRGQRRRPIRGRVVQTPRQ
jgi:hypothetical protein